MDENIVSYLKYLYDISEVEQKNFLKKLKNVSEKDKEKILISFRTEYKRMEKNKKMLMMNLRQTYNKAFEEIDYIQDNLDL